MICAHLNINSARNKFNLLSDIIKNNIDTLIISEIKLNSSFPNRQFQIHGYSEPYRFDRNENGGGIIVFIREDMPTKLTDSQMKIKRFFMELNLRRNKWFLCFSDNPTYSQISHNLKEIGRDLDVLTSMYGNIILMGKSNAEPADSVVSDFCEIYNLKNIIRKKTCFKNPNNPSCVDLKLQTGQNVFKILWLLRQVCLTFTKCVLR